MDVERTIQSILKAQVRSQASIGALTKLVHQGMRMLVKTETKLAELATSQKKLADDQRKLAASQKKLNISGTDTKFGYEFGVCP